VFIVILDLSLPAADRPAALAALDSEYDEIRAMPGNLAYRVYASRVDEGAVTVVHEWSDGTTMQGYLASDAFARLGKALRPNLTAPPLSRRFHAELVETVN
jgi:quinol monooxygenase YgiN